MSPTKPAAGCLQLIGGLLFLIGLGFFFAHDPGGLILVAIGGAIVWWGGRAVRERIRDEARRK